MVYCDKNMAGQTDIVIKTSDAGLHRPETGARLTGDSSAGEMLFCEDGLSFWGGVDPQTGHIIDAHHPDCGRSVVGKVVAMPTSRGSCSGSGVLLALALNGPAPAALIFREAEEILALGALVAGQVFERPIPVLRLPSDLFSTMASATHAVIDADGLRIDYGFIPLADADVSRMELTDDDRSMLDGADGPMTAMAMDIICRLAVMQGATRPADVTRGHIDGCILAHEANLRFAETMAARGAGTRIPAAINVISVDRRNWRQQGIADESGISASRLADSYVEMGVLPSFTRARCLPDNPPVAGECIGWSESNAVIYANSRLGAMKAKNAGLPGFIHSIDKDTELAERRVDAADPQAHQTIYRGAARDLARHVRIQAGGQQVRIYQHRAVFTDEGKRHAKPVTKGLDFAACLAGVRDNRHPA